MTLLFNVMNCEVVQGSMVYTYRRHTEVLESLMWLVEFVRNGFKVLGLSNPHHMKERKRERDI